MLTGKPLSLENTKAELTRLEAAYKVEQLARAKAFREQRDKLRKLIAVLEGEQPKKEADA